MVCYKNMEINPLIFKTYDIRGIYPRELNEKAASTIAEAFRIFLKNPRAIAVGRDVRPSGQTLSQAVIKTLRESGVDVVNLGVVPVDIFYFGVVKLKTDGGIYISASHNPRHWNGMNLCRRGAIPISSDSGIKKVQHLVTAANKKVKNHRRKQGKYSVRNVIDKYINSVWALAPVLKPRPLKIVLNGNFGVSAQLFRRLVAEKCLPFRIIGLNDRPNGKFPKGPPDPLLKSNRKETSRSVIKNKADLGVSWDADGDRCFFVDEKGKFIEGYFTTAVLASEALRRHPHAAIITDPRLIWAVKEAVHKLRGRLIISPPGMTRIAERMIKEHAVFAGEMSGHYYFRETFNRDNGFLPILLMLNLMMRENKKLSEIFSPFRKKYLVPEGEINFKLGDRSQAATILRRAASAFRGGKVSRIEGLSIEYPRWRFNLRPSNTEPLLRLNIEARDPKTLKKSAAKLSRLIKEL